MGRGMGGHVRYFKHLILFTTYSSEPKVNIKVKARGPTYRWYLSQSVSYPFSLIVQGWTDMFVTSSTVFSSLPPCYQP